MAHAHLACETLGDDSILQGDRVQLSRALINLIQNALHALPPVNGRVCIRSEPLETSIRVRVSDNGCGIPPENMGHLFTPHFTTRRTCGGTGLGLFIAKKIVQSHGGTLTVESVLNQGTTFTLELPRVAAFIGAGT
jgi:signal transduction histidine kinase